MRRLLHRPVVLLAFLVSLAARATAAQNNAAQALPLVGNGNGGTAFTRQCPAGQVLTGVRVRAGLVIDALGIKCRPVNANGALGGENDIGTLAGGTGGVFSSGSCPQGSVVMGQGGAPALPTGVGHLALRCKRWDPASRGSTGSTTAVVRVIAGAGFPAAMQVLSGTTSIIGASNCERATQPAVLLRGRAGAVIDAAGLTCNEP